MSGSKSTGVVARYTVKEDRSPIKGAGGLACLAFTAVLGCAFWAGAVVASTPLPH